MNLQITRLDLLIAVTLGVLLTFLSGHFAPAARTVETQRTVAVVIPAPVRAHPRDPDAGTMSAEPDRNNWSPDDGESRYGDANSPSDDQDSDDDLDSSYDPPDPGDTTPI